MLTFWGGALADRFDRKKIILVAQGIQFLAVVIMVVLLALGELRPWIVIFISLIVGCTDSLSIPSFQTIVPSLVSKDEIPQAISLNAIQFNLARTLGLAIAGAVLVNFGAVACFGLNAFSYIPFFLSIFLIYPAKGFNLSLQDQTMSKLTMQNTVKSVFQQEELRNQLLATFTTTLFCSPLMTFCPVLVKEVFAGELKDFGFLSTAFGLGGLIGAFVTFALASKFKQQAPNFFGLILGAIVIAAAANGSLNILLGLMVFAGAFLSMSNSTASSNLQTKANNQVRGRYASLFQLAFRSGLSFGALTTGIFTHHWGIVTALYINGFLALGSHLILLWSKDSRNSKLILKKA